MFGDRRWWTARVRLQSFHSSRRQRAYYPVGGNFHAFLRHVVLRPWVSALACIFKDRRRRTGRRKNRGALRYHDPIALRVASRVTES